jgi:hypothetical protein
MNNLICLLPGPFIPFILDVAGLLAAFTNHSHIGQLCSCGFVQLPPTCNVNDFGYSYLFLLLFVEAALVAAIGLYAVPLWIKLLPSWAHQTLINAKIQVRREFSAFRRVHHDTVATINAEKNIATAENNG